MNSTLFILAALAFVASVKAVVFPPASQFQYNITYSPMFYDGADISVSGVVHYKNGVASIEARDSLRTFENILLNGNTQYAAEKFGEFPADCKKTSLSNGVSFIPPFGFDSKWFDENAKKTGSEGGFDVYTVSGTPSIYGGNVEATLKFNGQGQVVSISQKSGSLVRTATFTNQQLTSQDDAFFKKPTSC